MPTVKMNDERARKLEAKAKAEYEDDTSTAAEYASVHFALGEYRTLTSEHELAVVHFTEAAKLGNQMASLKLGHCFKDGKGVAANPQQAFAYFKRAMNGSDLRVRSLAVKSIALLLISDAKKARTIPKAEGDSWFRETFRNAKFSNFQYYLTTASVGYHQAWASQPSQPNPLARLISRARRSLSPSAATPATADERKPLLLS